MSKNHWNITITFERGDGRIQFSSLVLVTDNLETARGGVIDGVAKAFDLTIGVLQASQASEADSDSK
ncbi:MAG: hypothetical protein ACK5BE_04180 [Alphaproteobacteria bacterium]|jgi:hypothetical protein